MVRRAFWCFPPLLRLLRRYDVGIGDPVWTIVCQESFPLFWWPLFQNCLSAQHDLELVCNRKNTKRKGAFQFPTRNIWCWKNGIQVWTNNSYFIVSCGFCCNKRHKTRATFKHVIFWDSDYLIWRKERLLRLGAATFWTNRRNDQICFEFLWVQILDQRRAHNIFTFFQGLIQYHLVRFKRIDRQALDTTFYAKSYKIHGNVRGVARIDAKGFKQLTYDFSVRP